MPSSAIIYSQEYKPPEPNPKHGPPDRTTIALLRWVKYIACTAVAAFHDILLLLERLTPEDQDRPIIPPDFYLLDNLYSDYRILIDVEVTVHGACAKYLLCCRRALAPTDSRPTSKGTQMDPELEIVAALDEFRRVCRELRTSIGEAVYRWGEIASTVHGNFLSIPSVWQWVSSVAPDCALIRRQSLLADFPSSSAEGARNLYNLGDAYMGLETIVERIDAARIRSPGADATVELRRNLQLALSAVLELEFVFRWYMLAVVQAKRGSMNWDSPISKLLAVEKD